MEEEHWFEEKLKFETKQRNWEKRERKLREETDILLETANS